MDCLGNMSLFTNISTHSTSLERCLIRNPLEVARTLIKLSAEMSVGNLPEPMVRYAQLSFVTSAV